MSKRHEFSVTEEEFKAFVHKLLKFGLEHSGYEPKEFAVLLGWASDALKSQMGIKNLMFDAREVPTGKEEMN